MERIEELISVLSDRAVITRGRLARHEHICKICGKPADAFRTTFSAFEYRISAICQACQDYYYLGDTGLTAG